MKRTIGHRGGRRCILMVLLSIVLCVGMIPAGAFAAGDAKQVIAVSSPQTASYKVDKGTALESVGLPKRLSVTVAPPADRAETSSSEEDAAVRWNGYYDSGKPGSYTLTAAFLDGLYQYAGPMPEITVVVSARGDDPVPVPSPLEEDPAIRNFDAVGSAGLAAKGNLNNLSISNPRLTADEADGLGKTVKSRSSKGFFARISAKADGDGARKVWVGYRFTLKVPDGMDKDWAKFTDVSYSWLMDLETGSKTATPTWDEAARTWTIEGKFYYDEANGLGSSGALEYSRSIAVTTGWLEEGMSLAPTIEVWLPEKEGDAPAGTKGDTVTIVTDPVLDTHVTNLTEAISALYSPSKKRLYLKQSEADADGALDAAQGRVYQFGTFTSAETQQKSGNALIPNGAPVTVDVPLSVTKDGAQVTAADEQPLLLAAHFDNRTQAAVNNYEGALGPLPGGADQDITYGGRINGYFTVDGQPLKDMTMQSVSYDSASNTIKTSLSSTADQPDASAVLLPGVTFAAGYYQVFVPVPKTDTKETDRTLSVGRASAEKIKHVGNTETKTVKPSDIRNIKVDYISDQIGDFDGAYSRNFRFGFSSPTSVAVGTDRMDVYVSVENFKTALWAEVNAYDLLVKVDADAYKIDTSSATVENTGNHDYKKGTYALKYGVLPGGGNWPSDEAMNSTRKDALTFYDPGHVPSGAAVVAIMVEARDGRLNIGKDELVFTNLSITDDAAKAGAVYQAVVDVDMWSGDRDPGHADEAGRPNVSMLPTEDGGYKKSWYGDDGTYHRDDPYQLSGDSLLLLAYDITGKSYNMNGTNRPTADADNTSTFDIVQGQRTADIRNEFTLNYLGKDGTENPNLEFDLELRIPKNVGNAVIDPDSIRIDAEYQPGLSEGAAGIISGGTPPIGIEEAWPGEYGLDWYKVVFKVKGSGTHNVYASVRLGDSLNPDRDVPIGKINYGFESIQASGPARLMVSGNTNGYNNFVITKSNAAGFSKVAASAGVAGKGEASYRMLLSAQDQNLTGALLLDILPFNGDGRGTKLSGSYRIERPLEFTVAAQGETPITDIDIYYTVDDRIQRNPLPTVGDLAGETVSGERVALLGVEWVKAPKTSIDSKHCSYAVPKETLGVIGVGKVGSNEAPMLDIHLQLNDMQVGDQLMNTAGFNANEFGRPAESGATSVNVSERQITGKAWVDANRNGKQDASEAGLEGLTVKLYQGATEITKDEYGASFNVVTDASGRYMFSHLASSPEKYHVEFTGGDIGDYAVTEKDAPDVEADENSDVTAHPATGKLVSAVSSEVNLLTKQQQNDQKQFLSVQQLDGGFVPRVTVSFDTEGGVPAVPSQTLLLNDKVVEPKAPAKENFVFAGWYHDGSGSSEKWDFNTPVTGNVNLKAHWDPAPAAQLSVIGTKTLSGGGKSDADITDGLFSFTVVRTDAHAADAVTGLPVGSVNVAAGGALNFGTWAFSKTGTYTFTLAENPVPAGYAQAADVLVTVEVVQKDNAALEATATYSSGDKVTFANTYTAPDGVGVTVGGTKTLTENNHEKALAAGQFSFQIKSADSNDPTGFTGPAAAQVDVREDGSFSFGELLFSKVGTYRFDITEEDKGVAGYVYDGKTVALTVEVAVDRGTNQLVATPTYTVDGEVVSGAAFENSYETPKAIEVVVDGVKMLTENGAAKAMDSGQFDFVMKADKANDAGGYSGPADNKASANDKGEIAFEALSFSKAGTYRFDVTEVDKKAAGYTYDDKVVTVTVDVTLDTDTNTLNAAVTYSEDGDRVDSMVFDNEYATPDPTATGLAGSVMLIGQKTTADIGDGDFTFTAQGDTANDPEGHTAPDSVIGVKKGGSIDFGDFAFTRAGTYRFTVFQNNLGVDGYMYDASRYLVTVTVALDTATNTLVPSVFIQKHGVARGEMHEVQAIEFVNEYMPMPVASDPPVEKVVKGDNPTTPGDFSFTFAAADKANPMPAGSENGEKTVSIKGAGAVEFGDLTFTKPGTYVYTVTERNMGQENYSYDAAVYTATYEVFDNAGRLEAKRTIVSNGMTNEKIVFTNTYTASNVPGTLGAPLPIIPRTGDPVYLLLTVLVGVCLTSGAAVLALSRSKRKSRK